MCEIKVFREGGRLRNSIQGGLLIVFQRVNRANV